MCRTNVPQDRESEWQRVRRVTDLDLAAELRGRGGAAGQQQQAGNVPVQAAARTGGLSAEGSELRILALTVQ